MDNTLTAAFLGLLEGLTEFIPVSSTGHLLLAGHFLGFESKGRTFEVVIQLGAILALFSVYAALLTRDQVRNLARDNVVAPGAKGLADLGITPTAMEAVLPEYLWRYRTAGPYAAIKDSAKNLKKA